MLLVGNHSGGNMTAGHGRLHARLQHLLRRRAALLPAGPQPRALDARASASCASTARWRPRPANAAKALESGRRAARLPGRRLRGAPAELGVRAGRLRRPQGLHPARARARRADRAGGVGRRPGDGALPQPRRAARQAAAARPDVPAEGAADLAGAALGAERRRHARPLAAARRRSRSRCSTPIDLREEFGEEPGPRRGLRRRARPDAGDAHRAPGGADRCRCSADAGRAAVDDRRPAARSVWERVARPGATTRSFMEGITRFRAPGGRRAASAACGVALLDADARRLGGRGRRWSRSWSSTSRGDLPGRASPASTSAGAGGCARPRTRRTTVTLRLCYEAPGGILGMSPTGCRRRWCARNLERTLENLQARDRRGRTEVSEPGTGLTGQDRLRARQREDPGGGGRHPADPPGQAGQGR